MWKMSQKMQQNCTAGGFFTYETEAHRDRKTRHRIYRCLGMSEKNYTGAIPPQQEGVPIDTSSSKSFESLEQAKKFYEIARNRLLDVNNWHDYAGGISAHFQLIDREGRQAPSPAQKGYRFKINIPGPGSDTGHGYDWVEIEALEEVESEQVESLAIRVRPTDNPEGEKSDTAHFYSRESTSTFTVTREGTKVTVAIYDRNTKPNTDAESTLDKIRDAVVGAAGIISFSKIQWKLLAEGILKE